VSGLQIYFDRAIGANLLYRTERVQYSDMRKQYVTGPDVVLGQEKDMSTIYGAEHLVRLLGQYQYDYGTLSLLYSLLALVSLPAIISHSSMDPDSTALIRDYVNDLLAWVFPTMMPPFPDDVHLDGSLLRKRHSFCRNTRLLAPSTSMYHALDLINSSVSRLES
jgi:hypothetical protein